MTRSEHEALYDKILNMARDEGPDVMRATYRKICETDLYTLLTRVLAREDARHDWVYERCMEVQQQPDGYIDIWAREHYKSTILNFALTIQDILKNPETKAVIYSFNRPTAKAFLRQIKREFETNRTLLWLYPEIFWEQPHRESPKWSEDEGITVKRKGNPKESTVEAFGLVDGQPTARHYDLLIYDDVVTTESVTTPEMIEKTTRSWEMSINTGSEGCRIRIIGTRYHYSDTYSEIINKKAAKPRIYPAVDEEGRPVLISKAYLRSKRNALGPYVYNSQMMCDPQPAGMQTFKESWLRFWEPRRFGAMNIYIIVDPAGSKRKKADYTSVWVLGLGSDRIYYVLDMFRDRMSLTERTRLLFQLHQKYRPKGTFYEKYGMQSDIEHILYVQREQNYRFQITEFGGSDQGRQLPKEDRIRKLVPIVESSRLYLPDSCIKRTYDGQDRDLVKDFIRDEYLAFPYSSYDDMLDAISRIADEPLVSYLVFPDKQSALSVIEEELGLSPDEYTGHDSGLDAWNPLE